MKILHTADWHIGQFKGPVVDGVNLRSQDTLVVSGRCDLKKSDILAYEEKAYLVLAVDNAGDLGFAGIAYLEERNDLK